MTRDQLAELLRDVNVNRLAQESGVATKTIYRLRHKDHAPTLDTVERLMTGLARIRALAGTPEQVAA